VVTVVALVEVVVGVTLVDFRTGAGVGARLDEDEDEDEDEELDPQAANSSAAATMIEPGFMTSCGSGRKRRDPSPTWTRLEQDLRSAIPCCSGSGAAG
jgi:hypothetical protein